MRLQEVAQLLCKEAIRARKGGKIPLFLGINGMLARMYDNITRHCDTGSKDYILDLAINSFYALYLALKEIPDEKPQQRNEEPPDVEDIEDIPDNEEDKGRWSKVK